MAAETSVLIADDHAVSSVGLQQLLAAQPGVVVLDPVSNGLDAVAAARLSQPDVAVLDYAMPGLNGMETMLEIRRWSPDTRVVILTGSRSNVLMSSLLAAGVDGLLLKSTPPSDIVASILAVSRGQRVIGPEIETDSADEVMTPREHQVLACIAEGLTNPGMAERLSISVKTVESHRASLMRKLGVNSTASLLVRAMRDGLIDP
jgi:DNA-binding NarL/FixJ family response regulator